MSRCPSQAPSVASTNHLSPRPALPTLVKSLESIPHNPSQPRPASVDSTFVSDISPYLPTKSCLSGTSNPTPGPSGSAHLASICILTSMSTSSSVSSSWGTTDVWGQIALCRGAGGAVPCAVGHPAASCFYPLDANSILLPSCDNPKCLQSLPNVPWSFRLSCAFKSLGELYLKHQCLGSAPLNDLITS